MIVIDDRPKEYCGVFGVYGHPEAARLAYYGLWSLQHRGQESSGIVTSDGKTFHERRGMGLVSDVFKEPDLKRLQGHIACGHTRYSTTGSSNLINAQPFIINHGGHYLCLGHNGNLVNAKSLKSRLEQSGSIFQSSMDSEIVMHLIARKLQRMNLKEAVVNSLRQLKGAYSFLFMSEDMLMAARDPQGFRPLCIGRQGDAYVVASETCALDLIDATFLREVEPGEVVFIGPNGLESQRISEGETHAHCIFEFVYFARPDSRIFGQTVYDVRKRQGAQLAIEYPDCKGDFVMPFPDSGNYAALGYASASHQPFEFGVIRNHYVGRTFISPSQDMRDFGVRVKLNPVNTLVAGKKVIIVEDSIVRGTTTRGRVQAMRHAGAAEVHMLVSCPPIRFPCHYGIDFSTKGELIACNSNVEQIRAMIGLDSLGYLSEEGLLASTSQTQHHYCMACFNGEYPVEIDQGSGKFCLENPNGDLFAQS